MDLKSCAVVVSFGVVAMLPAKTVQGADPDQNTQTADVLMKLHHANQMEVAAGKLAQEKGQSKDVKSFGKTLVSDHSAADKKVMALAKSEKIDLPAEVPMPPEKMDKMKAATGAEFDRMFSADMLDDHKNAIADAKAARDATGDTKLKSLLTATIPVLEKHRDTAQKLVDRLGPSASAGAAPVDPTAVK